MLCVLQTLEKLEEGGILPKDPEIGQAAVTAARACGKDQAEQLRLADILTRTRPP